MFIPNGFDPKQLITKKNIVKSVVVGKHLVDNIKEKKETSLTKKEKDAYMKEKLKLKKSALNKQLAEMKNKNTPEPIE